MRYSKDQLSPEDFLHFVNLDEFTDDWHDLGLNEDDLWALECLVMSDPKGPPRISGTGGLRKLRFAPERWHRGKSGAVRVLYVYFEEFWIVLLVKAYKKSSKENITEAEKQSIRRYIKATEKWLHKSGGYREKREP